MKKKLLILVLMVIILSGCSLFRKKKTDEATPEPKTRITEPVNLIGVAERPYLSLVPSQNGQKIELFVNKLNKPASEAEFELEYTAGELIKGAFGSIDLASGSGSYEILLGSCSTGGACSYDKDVSGGDVIISLKGDENYAIKTSWRYQVISKAESEYGSSDQKIQLEGENLFASSAYVVIADTSGLPGPVEGELLTSPYGIFPSNGIRETDIGTVSLRLNEVSETAQIFGWDGNEWISLETEVSDKTASTTGILYEAYIATR